MWKHDTKDLDFHNFGNVGNKLWNEYTALQVMIYLTEISRTGSGADLVVVLRRKRDGVYFRLAEGEVRSHKRLDMLERANVLYKGEWKKSEQTSARTIKEISQNKGIFFIKE